MNSTTAHNPFPAQLHRTPAAGKAVQALLKHLTQGQLTVQWPDGTVQTVGQPGELHASLVLHNWSPCEAALRSGDIGFAESFMAGDWSTPDLPALLQLLSANRKALDSLIFGHWAARTWHRVRHWLNRNTKANSRKNIHAHYDLGNDFYRLWLDPTMNYSSAWFQNGPPPNTQADLVAGQDAKVNRVLDMAGVQAGSRVLEIGCGWGALAEKAGQRGATVTGVTLSTEQLGFARGRLAYAGLAAQADLRLQDYRDIQDHPFDAICSVEMVEAVGQAFWPTYFGTVARLLKTGGKACLQSIVIRDDLFERYLQSSDFIQQYIFPGGCLPSPSAFRQQATAQGLEVVDEMAFGIDYAETCRLWRQKFLAQRDEVMALGFDDRFMRTWEFYLAYCEAGFRTGDVDVVQYTLAKT